jgi:hypothetical protein
MRPHRKKFIDYRQRKAAMKLQTRARAYLSRRKWLKILSLVLFVSCRWRGKVDRAKFKQVKREKKSNAALQEQVSNFQHIMKEGEETRRALEARTKEALALLQAAEKEAAELRLANEKFKVELEEKADEHALTTEALYKLQAKNEELEAQLKKLEDAAKDKVCFSFFISLLPPSPRTQLLATVIPFHSFLLYFFFFFGFFKK